MTNTYTQPIHCITRAEQGRFLSSDAITAKEYAERLAIEAAHGEATDPRDTNEREKCLRHLINRERMNEPRVVAAIQKRKRHAEMARIGIAYGSNPPPDMVIALAALYCDVDVHEIRSGRRFHEVAQARSIAVAILRRFFRRMSYPEIARQVGWDNHSSAITATTRAEVREAEAINYILSLLGRSPAPKPVAARHQRSQEAACPLSPPRPPNAPQATLGHLRGVLRAGAKHD